MWLWGGVLGVTFAVVATLISFVLTRAMLRGALATLAWALDLVNVALCVAIASFLAGALSRRFASGLIAGVLLVVVAQALSLLIILVTYVRAVSVRLLLQAVGDTLVALALLLLLGAGVGAGCGALGALLGRATARPSLTPPPART
jgi:hypothetical protein